MTLQPHAHKQWASRVASLQVAVGPPQAGGAQKQLPPSHCGPAWMQWGGSATHWGAHPCEGPPLKQEPNVVPSGQVPASVGGMHSGRAPPQQGITQYSVGPHVVAPQAAAPDDRLPPDELLPDEGGGREVAPDEERAAELPLDEEAPPLPDEDELEPSPGLQRARVRDARDRTNAERVNRAALMNRRIPRAHP